jgi:3-hydroxybutyryl-CoA dehydrogenase
MKIVIASNPSLPLPFDKMEAELTRLNDARHFEQHSDGDLYIDFLFNGLFYSPAEKPLLINETIHSFDFMNTGDRPAGRFCGWQSFVERGTWEVAVNRNNGSYLPLFTKVTGKQFNIVKDIAGLITPRMVAMIVNEAYCALSEKLSTKDEIDLAMKLGTNYPFGPFEWADMIGVTNIIALLEKIGASKKGFGAHPLMRTEELL